MLVPSEQKAGLIGQKSSQVQVPGSGMFGDRKSSQVWNLQHFLEKQFLSPHVLPKICDTAKFKKIFYNKYNK